MVYARLHIPQYEVYFLRFIRPADLSIPCM